MDLALNQKDQPQIYHHHHHVRLIQVARRNNTKQTVKNTVKPTTIMLSDTVKSLTTEVHILFTSDKIQDSDRLPF